MASEALAGRLIAGILASCCILAGCGRKGADVAVSWHVQTARPAAGVETVVEIRLTNRDGAAVSGAKLYCTAQMSHPGMAAVMGPVVERGAGIYEARLQLAMAGDWILVASGELPDGQRIESSFQLRGVLPATPTVSLP